MIPFNKPHITGKEVHYIYDAVASGKISGNGKYTKKCQSFFEETWSFKKTLMTTSCTDALEMAALLLDIKPGDEVIVPAYTFVSTALAFVRQGAKIVFADSRPDHPGIDESEIEKLITPRTKVIVPVHYAGVACDMDKIMELADKYKLWVVEDAAQSIDAKYKGRPLGSIGHLGCFSFHETKNIQCGEGGMLAINDERFMKRAEIIWEKGTNRAEFFRGEVNKYGWVDIGSSFLPSEVISAFLWAQIEDYKNIQEKRKAIWAYYYDTLFNSQANNFSLPVIPDYATNNAHMFYIICNSEVERIHITGNLKANDVLAVTHYLALNKSKFYSKIESPKNLVNCDRYEACLLRLPLYFDLDNSSLQRICQVIIHP